MFCFWTIPMTFGNYSCMVLCLTVASSGDQWVLKGQIQAPTAKSSHSSPY